MNNKFVVITSINPPNEAISQFAKWPGWDVVVVGDRKTPEPWAYPNVTYLNIEQQHDMFGEFGNFVSSIPENTYLRKMIGYIYAIRHGANLIFESDDDNIPYPDASEIVESHLPPETRKQGRHGRHDSGWHNVYRSFGSKKCWPRGFPLELINKSHPQIGYGNNSWGILQFLADEDPDVDAIYRMSNGESVLFENKEKIILDAGTYCPVNSQATLWTEETFPLLFLPFGVADRVTDILRGYIATTCLWKENYSVAYASPIVYQKRNAHNLFHDFMQEQPLYLYADQWRRMLISLKTKTMIDTYRAALQQLSTGGFITPDNIELYEEFLLEIGR